MKIYNKGIPPSQIYQQQLEEKQKEKISEQGKTSSDSLAISGDADKVREASAAARALDEARMDEVARLKEAIDKKQYILDSRKIAEAMLKKDEV